MLKHDNIYEIYEIVVSKSSDADKFLDLQTKFGIENVEKLCEEYPGEDIFMYVGKRLKSIENATYAFQEYAAYVKQLRATYRGQIFKEQYEAQKETGRPLR